MPLLFFYTGPFSAKRRARHFQSQATAAAAEQVNPALAEQHAHPGEKYLKAYVYSVGVLCGDVGHPGPGLTRGPSVFGCLGKSPGERRFFKAKVYLEVNPGLFYCGTCE